MRGLAALLLGVGLVGAFPSKHTEHAVNGTKKLSPHASKGSTTIASSSVSAGHFHSSSVSAEHYHPSSASAHHYHSSSVSAEHYHHPSSSISVEYHRPSSVSVKPHRPSSISVEYHKPSSVSVDRFQASPFNGVATASSSGTFASATASAQTVLTPCVHWNVSTSDPANIAPSKAQTLYYSHGGVNDPSQDHMFGLMDLNFTVHTVNVDHSDSVALTSNGNDLLVTFSDASALAIAQQTWPADEELLFITYDDICESYASDEFCYFLASSVTFNTGDLTADASGEIITVGDYLVRGTFEWGVWEAPPANPSWFNAASSAVSSAFASSTSGSPSPSRLRARESRKQARSASKSKKNNNNTACAAHDAKYNLINVALGKDFDNWLDQCIGFEDLDSTAYATYADSLDADQEDDDEVLTKMNSTNMDGTRKLLNYTDVVGYHDYRLAKRWSLIKAIGHAFTKIVQAIPIKVPGINAPLEKEFNKEFDFKLPKEQKLVDSPFGNARLLKEFKKEKTTKNSAAEASLKVYCVDCGASGSIKIAGKASYEADKSVTSLQEGYVQANANLLVVFQLGVDAEIVYTYKFNTDIASYGILGPQFGFVKIGPTISVGVDVDFEAKAHGTLLAGASFGIQNAETHIDFVDKSKSSSRGWTPEFKPVFKATGEVSLGVEVGLPIALACGIKVQTGPINIDYSVGIVERPAIVAKAEFSAEADKDGARITTTDGCAGIGTQISFKNNLYADIIGTHYDLLAPYEKVLDKGCIVLAKSKSSSSESASPSATSDASSSSSDVIASATDASSSDATPSATPDASSADASASMTADSSPASATGDAAPSSSPAASPTGDASAASPTVSSASGDSQKKRSIVDVTSAALANTTVSTSSWTLPQTSFDGFNTTGDDEVVTLVDSTNTYMLSSCADNNLYIQRQDYSTNLQEHHCSVSWQNLDGTIIADGLGRLMHYYNHTMKHLGVSRVRTSDSQHIPNTSVFITLVAFNNQTGELDADVNDDTAGSQDFYFAVDSAENVFFPVVCAYTDYASNPAKLFLVKELEAGIAILESKDVEYSITGGEVSKCYSVPLMRPYGSQTASSYDDDSDVNETTEGDSTKLDNTENYRRW